MHGLHKKYQVTANGQVCEAFWQMTVAAPEIADSVKAGQFVHIRIGEGTRPFFRRPFSVYRSRHGQIQILYEVVGDGTRWLAEKKQGDPIDALGPLGRGFSLPKKGIRHVIMIAGGVGVAPLQLLADELAAGGPDIEKTLLYGGRDAGHVLSLKDFQTAGCQVRIATDDGSHGAHGRVSVLLDEIPTARAAETFIYTCGPRPMMAAVQAFARGRGVPGEASCEEVMACGIGACLGCVIETQKGYQTTCHDGPVFDLAEVIF